MKANYDPFASLRLFAGGRYDMFSGETTDNMSGAVMDMRDYDIWSASGGAIYSFLDHYSLYANTGTGFQLPQGSDKYQVIAPDESSLFHWEIGTKAEWDRLLLRYAYFHSAEDTIRWVNGEYINEGDTDRSGHELEISFSPLAGLQLFSSLTLHEATYEGGENQGMEVPSIPEYILKVGGEYRFSQGTSLSLWYRDTGEWYTTADNLHAYSGYEVVDVQAAQEIGDSWKLALDIKNLLNEEYSEYVGYWDDPYGVPDNQYAGSDGRYIGLTLSYRDGGWN
ncbi:MAG: TonB-dependent receptor [Candidatus Electrothrix sp. ATG1]|nr:TonB-dependent receptor [Candidatus Electrothrix sp. ATG1]